jgi:hypothetical protein
MVAKPPTCSTCGAVLMGLGWSEELNFQVSFCPQCRAREATSRAVTKKQVAEMRESDEAA